MFELIRAEDCPNEIHNRAKTKPLSKLPIRDLLPGEALRIPLAHLGKQEQRKAYGSLRVRATRAGQATGGTFSTHLDQSTVYIVRLT